MRPTQEPTCAPPLAAPAQWWTTGAPSSPSDEDAKVGAVARWPISAAADIHTRAAQVYPNPRKVLAISAGWILFRG
ncbi:unnamed protein product [Urochloa humidicola]